MSNPSLTISFFRMRTTRALVKESYTANVYSADGFENMGHAMAETIKHAKTHKIEHYWTFARYKRNHKKDDIQELTAIMLEYPYDLRAQLAEALNDCSYAHYIIHAQDEINTKRPEERLLVAFPLNDPITNPKDYTRIASLLSEQLGVGEHSKGDFSSTFLFAPFTGVCSTPKIILNDLDRTYLDAEQFLEENRGVWTNARLLQEGAPQQPQQTVDDTSLFAW